MLANPWMVEPGVVDDEIEDQRHAAGVQLPADGVQVLPRAELRVRLVTGDAERRADDVLRPPARQRAIVGAGERRLRPRQLPADRAAAPYAHQIDDVDAERL